MEDWNGYQINTPVAICYFLPADSSGQNQKSIVFLNKNFKNSDTVRSIGVGSSLVQALGWYRKRSAKKNLYSFVKTVFVCLPVSVLALVQYDSDSILQSIVICKQIWEQRCELTWTFRD